MHERKIVKYQHVMIERAVNMKIKEMGDEVMIPSHITYANEFML